jgi:hypothetical protein
MHTMLMSTGQERLQHNRLGGSEDSLYNSWLRHAYDHLTDTPGRQSSVVWVLPDPAAQEV